MSDLGPGECDLRGDWLVQGNSVVADSVEERIKWLTERNLERIATDRSGWETLFRDPRDGRLWELTFPQSEMHGGGPRRLHVLTPVEAATKYPHARI